MKMIKRLWSDEAGFVVSSELILVGTVAVIGMLVGLAAVRDGVVSELSDVAGAVQDLNQSYSLNGVTGHSAATAGMSYLDGLDWCDDSEDLAGVADNCITFTTATPVDDEGTTLVGRIN